MGPLATVVGGEPELHLLAMIGREVESHNRPILPHYGLPTIHGGVPPHVVAGHKIVAVAFGGLDDPPVRVEHLDAETGLFPRLVHGILHDTGILEDEHVEVGGVDKDAVEHAFGLCHRPHVAEPDGVVVARGHHAQRHSHHGVGGRGVGAEHMASVDAVVDHAHILVGIGENAIERGDLGREEHAGVYAGAAVACGSDNPQGLGLVANGGAAVARAATIVSERDNVRAILAQLHPGGIDAGIKTVQQCVALRRGNIYICHRPIRSVPGERHGRKHAVAALVDGQPLTISFLDGIAGIAYRMEVPHQASICYNADIVERAKPIRHLVENDIVVARRHRREVRHMALPPRKRGKGGQRVERGDVGGVGRRAHLQGALPMGPKKQIGAVAKVRRHIRHGDIKILVSGQIQSHRRIM